MAEEISKTFRLMRGYLDDQLNGRTGAPIPRSTETSGVKTYFLETILPEASRPEVSRKFITTFLRQGLGGRRQTATISHSQKDPLITVKLRRAGNDILLFINFENSRFLRVHSASDTEILERVVARWATYLPELDHAWFNDDFMDWCTDQGKLKGIGVEFNNGFGKWRSSEQAQEAIKLKQRGASAPTLLTILRNSPALNHQATLSQVRLRNDDSISLQHTTDDVRFDGRISCRGNSFDAHLQLVERVFSRYQSTVRELEKRHCLRAERNGNDRVFLQGQVFRIDLAQPIQDMGTFARAVFSGTKPFRLAGVPRQVAPGQYQVAAVDVHTAQHLRFEMLPELIRVYLPGGACGNTLLRFHTNLQHWHSRNAKMYVPQG